MGDTIIKRCGVCLKSEDGVVLQVIDLPIDSEVKGLVKLINVILGRETVVHPYRLYLDDRELTTTIKDALTERELSTELALEITYIKEAFFSVNPIARCTSSISGHAEAITCAAYCPKGRELATGSGDTTVRIWDTSTQTPRFQLQGHKNWILCVAWAPDGEKIASGDKNGVIAVWNGSTGEKVGKFMTGHSKWVTCLAWEPYHLNQECRNLVSGSKDGTLRIWDTKLSQCIKTLSSHTFSVLSVRWGSTGLIYSTSQDKTIKIWDSSREILCRTLDGHAHWVNSLALNSDYVLKGGKFSRGEKQSLENVERLVKAVTVNGEIFATGSDDMTVILWSPKFSQIARLTGHQQVVNDVKFSPDGRTLASASYDKTIRLWHGTTGKFITVFRGHVQQVYVMAWSPDSRLLISGSADSTLKVWDCRNYTLAKDLSGHADDVYAVDWSFDGTQVASGGKDKSVRLWSA